MKKRHLRKGIDIALTIITITIMALVFSIDSFEHKHLPFIASAFGIVWFNVKILNKYSRIWGFDND